MSTAFKKRVLALAIPALAAAMFPAVAAAQEPPCPFHENRSGLCGYYDSEISPARAYLDTENRRDKWGQSSPRAVILDVRSTPEFKAGHPEQAYNVPFPYIHQTCDASGRTPDGACAKGKVAEIAQDPDGYLTSDEMQVVLDAPGWWKVRVLGSDGGVQSVMSAD